MHYSLLGPTGVKVSKICLGTATFGVAPDAQEAARVVHAALDLGINFFDTANVYGATPTFDRPGLPPAAEREPAEQILGRALAGRRDDVVIATKSGERRFDPAAGLSRRYIIQQVERSLRRGSTRLAVEPARCLSCGFVFRERAARHLHAPGRCPRCRSERIADPRFYIA